VTVSECQSGIYWIVRIGSGQSYVGSAINFVRRWAEHRRLLEAGKHHSRHLQNAWNKYGPDAFQFDILARVPRIEGENTADFKARLLAEEQACIDTFLVVGETGYNILPTAGSCLGRTLSPKTRAAISVALKGRPLSPEHCAKLSVAVSAAKKGRPLSPEHCAKLSVAMSAANRGRKLSPESIAKLSVAMSAANRGRKLSPESIAKRGATRAANRQVKLLAVYNYSTDQTPHAPD
jgi:group I intron endonuclease